MNVIKGALVLGALEVGRGEVQIRVDGWRMRLQSLVGFILIERLVKGVEQVLVRPVRTLRLPQLARLSLLRLLQVLFLLTSLHDFRLQHSCLLGPLLGEQKLVILTHPVCHHFGLLGAQLLVELGLADLSTIPERIQCLVLLLLFLLPHHVSLLALLQVHAGHLFHLLGLQLLRTVAEDWRWRLGHLVFNLAVSFRQAEERVCLLGVLVDL